MTPSVDDPHANESPHDVHASLLHIRWIDLYYKEKPFQIFLNIPADAEDRRATNLEWEPLPRTIHDIRGNEESFSLDEHGFMFRRYPSAVSPSVFADRQAVEEKYLPEVEQLIRNEVDGIIKVIHETT